MGHLRSRDGEPDLHLYKHYGTRRYLNVDDQLRFFAFVATKRLLICAREGAAGSAVLTGAVPDCQATIAAGKGWSSMERRSPELCLSFGEGSQLHDRTLTKGLHPPEARP